VITARLPWEMLPHQARLVASRPPGDAVPGPITVAALGGWGSGKTQGIAYAFTWYLLGMGWHLAYGRKRPQAVVLAPNLRLARKNQLDLIDSILPAELVRRRWGMPEPKLLLTNGVEISAISADANYEGESLVACWCDEIQHELYSSNPERYTNMVARLRDPKARRPHTRMFVSGLPVSGWVRDTFDVRSRDPNRKTVLWSSALNTKLAAGVREAILKATPAGMEATFLEGQWMPIPGALYPQYSDDLHLTEDPGNRQAPVSIGLDAGNRSAVEIGQRQTVPGTTDVRLHVVDEILGDGLSVEELVERFVASGWFMIPGKSEIYVDPTLRRDELRPLYARFPGIRVVQRERSDEYHDVWRGVRLVQSGLRNAAGQTRLTINRALAKNQRGVVESLVRMRTNPRTGTIAVDDQRDHPNDALRYLACGILGRQLARPEVTPR
jgi:hypothetical protein